MSSALQISSGALLMLFVLLDVFLAVLYARAGTGIFSRFVCAWEWQLLGRFAKLFGQREELFLSLCGPAIIVSLISWWALLLTLGAALIIHPYLGSAIVTSNGSTPTDFVSAMYAAANSMSIVGSSSFSPQTSTFRLVYMFNSIVGLSVTSLTLTYLMQIYNALQQRNSLGLHLFLLSGMTSSSAEMLVHIAPEGRVDSGFSTLSDLARSIIRLKEVHHLYPVLLYVRFEEAYYSISFITSMLLDCASLIECAMDATEYKWLQGSGTLAELWSGSLLLLDMLQGASPATRNYPKRPTTESEVEQWRHHYLRSVDLFKSVGLQPAPDLEQGANRYIELRKKWAPQISALANFMLYPTENVDPSSAKGSSKRVPGFRIRRHASRY